MHLFRLSHGLALVLSVLLAALGYSAVAEVGSAGKPDALWRALAGGDHVALLRHALAPGTGDPRNFALGDCTTQRNLSQVGRTQAASIGKRLRENGIGSARVYASQWCRTRETAELLQLGPVEDLAALNSFFAARDRAQEQTRALTQWLAKQDLARPLVLVTHQVNITELTGVYPASGELVVLKRMPTGTLEVVGTIKAD